MLEKIIQKAKIGLVGFGMLYAAGCGLVEPTPEPELEDYVTVNVYEYPQHGKRAIIRAYDKDGIDKIELYGSIKYSDIRDKQVFNADGENSQNISTTINDDPEPKFKAIMYDMNGNEIETESE